MATLMNQDPTSGKRGPGRPPGSPNKPKPPPAEGDRKPAVPRR